MYYIVHKDRPREALRVCHNVRAANMIVSTIGSNYEVTVGPIDCVINRTVNLDVDHLR